MARLTKLNYGLPYFMISAVVIALLSGCGNSAATRIVTGSPLSISASPSVLASNATSILTAAGGVPPYSYSLASGAVSGASASTLGSISGNIFTAGASANGIAVVQVTDSAGNLMQTTLTLQSSLVLDLSASVISTGGTVTLSATGGAAPYTYSIVSGGGTLSGATYTAPSTNTNAVVQVTDANHLTATATIAVQYSASLQISPSIITVYASGTVTFTASGGSGNYTYSVMGASGTLAGGVYTAPASYPATVTVQVTDSAGNVSSATVTVSGKPLQVTSSFSASSQVMVVYNMPNSETLFPSFSFGGANASAVFGAGINGVASESTAFATYSSTPSASATGVLVLTNFNWKDPFPYVGTLSEYSTVGLNQYNFCVQMGQQNAYLNPLPANKASTSLTYFPINYSSLSSLMSGGINLTGFWILGTNSGSQATETTVQIQDGLHNHQITNCSGYTGLTLSSQSNQ